MIVVVPMAGHGSRFSASGYNVPKPFIPVEGKPMFLHALRSINDIQYALIVFIVLKKHLENFNIQSEISKYGISNFEIITLEEVTEGQLDTVLKASDLINKDEDILIISSDTYVKSSIDQDILKNKNTCSGIISVAKMPGSQWSFARLNEKNEVDLVAEKERISDLASTGLYYFSSGRRFVSLAKSMIAKKEKTRNEYYVIPVYQKYIESGERILVSIAEETWDMGTPESLKLYLDKHNQKSN